MSLTTRSQGTILLWDPFVRLTHWLLVLLVFASWITARTHRMSLHRYSGYAILGLVIFRVYWGFFGSHFARFKEFLRGPRSVLKTLSAKSIGAKLGHTALGGWSILAMLSLLFLQAALGLFAVDVDGLESGPLAARLSFDTGRLAAKLHATVFNFLLALIAAHILAIAFYLLFKRENLIAPMLTGRKRVPHETIPAIYRAAQPWHAYLALMLIALLLTGIVTFF